MNMIYFNHLKNEKTVLNYLELDCSSEFYMNIFLKSEKKEKTF